MEKKTEFLIGFYRNEKPDGSFMYSESRSSINEFDTQEKNIVLQLGNSLDKKTQKTWSGRTHDYYYRLIKNKVWSDNNGFFITSYGYAASTAFFTILLESDLEANIKLKEFYTLMVDGKVKDNRIFANLTFGLFGNARYLMEAK